MRAKRPTASEPATPAPDARDRLVAAADTAFYTHGIKATGVDEVARRAEVTKRTLYDHFRSKDDLIEAYVRRRDATTLERMIAAAESGGRPSAAEWRRLFGYFAKRPMDATWNDCALVRAAAEFSDTPAHAASAEPARHKKRFDRWVADAARRDGYALPATLARQLIVLVDGAATQMMLHRNGRYATAAGRAALCLLDASAKVHDAPSTHRSSRASRSTT